LVYLQSQLVDNGNDDRVMWTFLIEHCWQDCPAVLHSRLLSDRLLLSSFWCCCGALWLS